MGHIDRHPAGPADGFRSGLHDGSLRDETLGRNAPERGQHQPQQILGTLDAALMLERIMVTCGRGNRVRATMPIQAADGEPNNRSSIQKLG